ncbi:MAG: hypothetical protein IMF09_12315 [Proteobacteria bacterium]|nr:hypothetical protein [Pseudomonadota bacterium]
MISPDWRDVFPYEEASQVIDAIKKTWGKLVKRNFEDFQPETDEPKLTIRLKILLSNIKNEFGLTGYFTAEGVEGKLDMRSGSLDKMGRTDILYVSRGVEEEFTFEFKKLTTKPDSRRAYHKFGIMRFVTGKYSDKKNLDFMVAIIIKEAEADEILTGLTKSFAKPDIKSALHMLTNDDGDFVIKPSSELPDSVNFDTKHARTLLPDSPDITICHFHVSHIKN